MTSSQPPSKPPHPPLTSSPYPFAAAPDIIRAHQKDAYFQGLLANQISDLQRRWLGARSAHAWASEARTAGDLLYHCLTTLIGNRTLGEEYCDLVQVEAPTPLDPLLEPIPTNNKNEGAPILPALPRRAGYIFTSILLPYFVGRLMPSVRSSLRARLQARLTSLAQKHATKQKSPNAHTKSTLYRLQRYILTHLTDLTSGAHFQAIVLAVFYFTGAYYSLSKRLFGLRYVFTKRMDDHLPGGGSGGTARAGYEVLGVLLLVQMLVRGWIHIRAQLSSGPLTEDEAGVEALIRERAFGSSYSSLGDVSLDENAYSSNNALLAGGMVGSGPGGQRGLVEIGMTTHTPVVKGGRARYDLSLPLLNTGKDKGQQQVMGWIKGYQQRKCTLCLDEMKDPAATSCGHVFCWTCIGDWVREKPECPLCRREALVQHILPLRAASA
ncbi:Pex2 / Pex12 amino terminal region domain containing protein [Rhypophila sp. PSN 637]